MASNTGGSSITSNSTCNHGSVPHLLSKAVAVGDALKPVMPAWLALATVVRMMGWTVGYFGVLQMSGGRLRGLRIAAAFHLGGRRLSVDMVAGDTIPAVFYDQWGSNKCESSHA